MSVAELALAAGVSQRAIRYYIERGVLPRADFHGTRTRYGRDHLLRLLAIAAMQKERLDLDAIRRRLTTLSAADLEAYAPAREAPSPTAVSADAAPARRSYESVTWDHIVLLPGVALIVHADVHRHLAGLIGRIVQLCARPPEAERPTPED